MGSPIDLTDPAVILSEIKRGSDLSVDAAEKGDKVVTDLARRIIELSIADPSLVRDCIENSDDPSLGHEILRLSFDYRNFSVAKDAIQSGVTFQEVLLLADDSDLEKIGSSIYEMYRQCQNTSIIDFFCNQLIGSKSTLRQSIAKEASLYSDTNVASALEANSEVQFGSRKATLRRRRRSRISNPREERKESHFPSPDELFSGRGSSTIIPEVTTGSIASSMKSSILSVETKESIIRRLNATTAYTHNSIANICINYLENKGQSNIIGEVLLIGLVSGCLLGISAGFFIGIILGRIF
ncbi:unnamed protein product [Oikopleura dioica]|uniref:Uncharacterized protein n=1 Tax=Oikopleura dioica TaxID=34765 RepID=E4Y2S5_OIKDI|nr:unnamed protein product [Oikopleura dioica]